ncbi:MAG TPA: PLP-dependent aminotransferase family protein [Spirochaetota bacterium]|nr:PLP-dependent aminotransferase family protein [Spirochaetota bacterium]HPJ34790.1 PLP-dependent aminotransferase family protein [Spirochaetota bacterium]
MIEKYSPRYSDSSLNMKSSVIRELLKFTEKPGMISFAGGLPGPEAFPVEEIKSILNSVIEKYGSAPLQYGTTEGLFPLREEISRLMYDVYETEVSPDSIIVTSGSQQALYLLCKVLLNRGDAVITENPTYTGALSTFNSFMADIYCADIDERGMTPESLIAVIEELRSRGIKPAFIYTMPAVHNPAGVSMDAERKWDIYRIALKYDLLIVEDDPYGMINYDGEPVIPVKYFDSGDRVVYLGSFSKILSPGLRTGWMAAGSDIIRRCSIAKQGEDLCSGTLSQYAIYSFLSENLLPDRINRIREIYRCKRDLMADSIDAAVPGAEYLKPEGGLFLWVRLPSQVDAEAMLPKALERQVAYVAGNAFYPHGGGRNELRLNFTYASKDDITEGIRRLGEVVTEEITMWS